MDDLPPMTGSGVLDKAGDAGDIGFFAYIIFPEFMPFPFVLFPFSFPRNTPLSPHLRL